MSQEEKFLRSQLHHSVGLILLENENVIHGIATLYDVMEYGCYGFSYQIQLV